MSSDVTDNDVTCSHCSDHEPCVSPTSTCLALAFCTLIEHVAQDVVVAVFVHVVDSHMSVTKSATRSYLECATILVVVRLHTAVDCPVADICARVPDRKDTHSLDYCAPSHGVSSRFCV
jgi:hypothetical protein